MSLKIRLARAGAKKRPYYRIVVTDSRSPRDGRYIEKLGTYNPLLPRDGQRVNLVVERAKHWLSHGAQPTDRVLRFLDAAGLLTREARANPNKGQPGKKRIEREEAKVVAEAEKAKAAAEAGKSARRKPGESGRRGGASRQFGGKLRRRSTAEHLPKQPTLLAHGLHHVGHLPVHFHKLIDVLHVRAGTRRHAPLARGIEQLGVLALGFRHGADDRLLALQDRLVEIGGVELALDLTHAG